MPTLKHGTEKETIAFRYSASIIDLCEQTGVILDMPVTEIYRQVFTDGLESFLKGVSMTLDASIQLEEFGAPNAFKTPAKAAAFRRLRAHAKVKVTSSGKTRPEESEAS